MSTAATTSTRDFAVLYRTNAQSRALEKVFVRRRIPHKVGGVRFYERKEVKDVLAYLGCSHNPDDRPAWPGSSTCRRAASARRRSPSSSAGRASSGISWFEALRRLREGAPAPSALSARPRAACSTSSSRSRRWSRPGSQLDVVALIDHVLEMTGYADYVLDGTEEGDERWQNIRELGDGRRPVRRARAAGRAGRLPRGDGPGRRRRRLRRGGRRGLADHVPRRQGARVPGRVPDRPRGGRRAPLALVRRPRPDGGGAAARLRRDHPRAGAALPRLRLPAHPLRRLDDERALALHRRHPRLAQAGPAACGRTPATRCAATSSRPARRRASSASGSATSTARSRPRPPLRDVQFVPGDRVRHPKFGEGIVVSSALAHGDEEVTVAFQGSASRSWPSPSPPSSASERVGSDSKRGIPAAAATPTWVRAICFGQVRRPSIGHLEHGWTVTVAVQRRHRPAR